MNTIKDTRRDLNQHKARSTISQMRAWNLILRVAHNRAGREWRLSDGTHVTDSVARRVIIDPAIVPCADGLFLQTPQSWRHVASNF